MSYLVQCNVCEESRGSLASRNELAPAGWVPLFATFGNAGEKTAITAGLHICPRCAGRLPANEAELEQMMGAMLQMALSEMETPAPLTQQEVDDMTEIPDYAYGAGNAPREQLGPQMPDDVSIPPYDQVPVSGGMEIRDA